MFGIDRKFRLPRIWSNGELKKFAPLFSGDVANVSGWRDEDKEGGHYKDYFVNAKTYTITNYKAEARGFQGNPGEIFLDLSVQLPDDMVSRFDVVFNHTVLEHIFEVEQAFRNLCLMSRDIVILVVPFLQQMHTDYGDYWRLTPLAVKKLFEKNGFDLLYLNFNEHDVASVYIFAIASRRAAGWKGRISGVKLISSKKNYDGFESYAGSHSIRNILFSIRYTLSRSINKLTIWK